MTKEKYRATVDQIVYLAACAIDGTVPDRKRIDVENLDGLYKVAEHQLLTGITAIALKRAGIRDARFQEAGSKAIRKVLLLDTERQAVERCLEEAGIWYLPLKGSVLKDLYPAIGMRQMSDCDILIDPTRTKDIRTIMESRGFHCEMFGRNHSDNYHKPPVYNFEMHWRLFEEREDIRLHRYYSDIPDHLRKDPDRDFGFHLSDEDFYLFMIAHEYKHYMGGGTGLRSLLDTWVFWRSRGEQLDRAYLEQEMEKLGILEFERKNRELALHLFERTPLSPEENETLDYMCLSGVYGTVSFRTEHKIRRYGNGTGARLRYAFRRIVLPMERVEQVFPQFAKHKVLLPFLPFYRMIRALRTRRWKIREEVKTVLRPVRTNIPK